MRLPHEAYALFDGALARPVPILPPRRVLRVLASPQPATAEVAPPHGCWHSGGRAGGSASAREDAIASVSGGMTRRRALRVYYACILYTEFSLAG